MWMLTLFLCTLCAFLGYRWLKSGHGYWEKWKIPFIKPVPLFGSMMPVLTGKKSFADLLQEQYVELKAGGLGYGGIFEFITPTIMVTDPELLREVTVKSFEHFAERRTPDLGDDTDPLFHRSLSSLRGEQWKQMRSTLSPAFTSSKLRAMVPLISNCCENFVRTLRTETRTPIEMGERFTRFASDVIGSVAFGLEGCAVRDERDEFFTMGQRLRNFSGLRYLIVAGYMLCPRLMRLLGISFTPKDISTYFRKRVIGTMEQRAALNISRPDMLQLLMAAQKGGIKRSEGDEDNSGTLGEDSDANVELQRHFCSSKRDLISDEDIAAQAFIFFLAGFETVSSLLSFVAHLLACNPEVQQNLLREIEQTDEITYETIRDMKYLDMVVSETLRLYPPAVFSDRRCTKNFKFPGSDFVMEKGQGFVYPIYALQRDPEFFPDPDKFNPDRFSDENKKNIRPYTYLPFGSGPHNCIGMRFALLETKICIAHLLKEFELMVCAKTEIPLKLSTKSFQMKTDNGFWLEMKKLK